MAKIILNNKEYNIDDAVLASINNELKNHFMNVINGLGATIKFDGATYGIDSGKLSTATTGLATHLGTIAGNGLKVVIGGVEYNVDISKVGSVVSSLESSFGELESGGSDIPNEEPSVDSTTGEILDSWEIIINNINNGTYATKYAVGNYKPLDLGVEGVVNMQIVAMDTDLLSDGSGNAHITWIAKELLATRHNMNSSLTSTGGWAASEMRTYLYNDIWALIPATVQNVIVEVDKTYYDYKAA